MASLLENKMTSYQLLKEIKMPVAKTLFTSDLKKALKFLKSNGFVVVKPNDLSGGKAITTDIKTKSQLHKAILSAQRATKRKDKKVIIQEQLPGDDCRVEANRGHQQAPHGVVGSGGLPVAFEPK